MAVDRRMNLDRPLYLPNPNPRSELYQYRTLISSPFPYSSRAIAISVLHRPLLAGGVCCADNGLLHKTSGERVTELPHRPKSLIPRR